MIFMGGGGAKIMCGHAHHEREARRPLRPGSRAPLGFFDALSCYLSLIFKHSDAKRVKKHTVDPILGEWGARLLPPL